MAKRAPAGEPAYNPLDEILALSVIQGAGTAQETMDVTREEVGEGSVEIAVHSPMNALNGRGFGASKGQRTALESEKTCSRNLHREKRVLLTPEEERQVERLVVRIGEQLGTSLKLSHLLRACMTVLCHAEAEVIRFSLEHKSLKRPANGDAVALAQFEEALAKLLSKSLRDAPLIR